MPLRLLAIFLSALVDGYHPSDAGHLPIVYHVQAAVCVEGTDGEVTCDERLGAVLTVTGARESRGRDGLRGDHGAACGRYQLHIEWRQGHPCTELDANGYLDARLAADALRVLTRTCGSLEGAVRAYASGHCGWAWGIARERCTLAGGC